MGLVRCGLDPVVVALGDVFGDIGTDPPASVYVDQATGRGVFQTIMEGKHWSGEGEMFGFIGPNGAGKEIQELPYLHPVINTETVGHVSDASANIHRIPGNAVSVDLAVASSRS